MRIDAGTMRAAIVEGHGKPLGIHSVEIPRPGPGQVLIRLKACGVCHSDVHVWNGEVVAPEEPKPFIMGHEGIGTVVEIGPDTPNWTLGETAGVPWIHDTCGECPECLDGEESFCQNQRANGLNVPGAFAEYVVADGRFAVKIGADIDPVALAPIMCAGVTAYGAIRRAKVQAGETLTVFGCGGLGLYAVQIATRLGARVIAVDRDPDKLAFARKLGAAETEIADAGLEERLSAPVRRADAVINFAPTTATWPAMMAGTKPRGRIVAAALVSQPVDLNQEWLTITGITLTGTSVGTRQEMAEVVAMHLEEPLFNEIMPIGLEQTSDALTALHEGRAKGRYVIAFE